VSTVQNTDLNSWWLNCWRFPGRCILKMSFSTLNLYHRYAFKCLYNNILWEMKHILITSKCFMSHNIFNTKNNNAVSFSFHKRSRCLPLHNVYIPMVLHMKYLPKAQHKMPNATIHISSTNPMQWSFVRIVFSRRFYWLVTEWPMNGVYSSKRYTPDFSTESFVVTIC